MQPEQNCQPATRANEFLFDFRRRIELTATFSEIKIGVPPVIRGRRLRSVTNSRNNGEDPDRSGKPLPPKAKREMRINAQPDNVIDKRVHNSSKPTVLTGEAGELSIRV